MSQKRPCRLTCCHRVTQAKGGTLECTWVFINLNTPAIQSLSVHKSIAVTMSNSSGDDSGNRFSAVDDDHHGGILWITASLSLTYFVLSCILRVFLSRRQLTKDALCLVAATVCLDIDSILPQLLFGGRKC